MRLLYNGNPLDPKVFSSIGKFYEFPSSSFRYGWLVLSRDIWWGIVARIISIYIYFQTALRCESDKYNNEGSISCLLILILVKQNEKDVDGRQESCKSTSTVFRVALDFSNFPSFVKVATRRNTNSVGSKPRATTRNHRQPSWLNRRSLNTLWHSRVDRRNHHNREETATARIFFRLLRRTREISLYCNYFLCFFFFFLISSMHFA